VPGKRVATPTRRRARNTLLKSLIAAAAGAVLLLVIGWAVYALVSDGTGIASKNDENARAAGRSADGGSSSESVGGTPVDAVVQACAAEIAVAEEVVAAAEEGVENWSAHVQARTDMIEGSITETEMNSVWERTQDAGPLDQQRFSAVRQTYDGQPSCDQLQNASDVPTKDGDDCLARASAANNAVIAADEAMIDWNTHLDHMAAYADGGMTSGRAQRLWVSAWREAPANISAFEDARASLREVSPCGDGSSASR